VTDLVTFIRARLAEREALAKACSGDEWAASGDVALHAAANDPAYVLRDIAAKRAIVDAYENAVDIQDQPPYTAGLAYAIAEIATVDEDHPDYDESWRP
jgi:hypothetical protein